MYLRSSFYAKIFVDFLLSESVENYKVLIARMHSVGIRLQHTNFALKEYAKEFLYSPTFLEREPTPEEIQEINKKIFRTVVSLTSLFERLVINLYNLIEIHQELEKYLEPKNLERIEKLLADCWQFIKNQEELIRKWRNNILAHGTTWNKEEIFAITEITKDTFKAQKDIYLCSGYAIIYIQSMLKNMPEYQEVFQTIKKKHESIPQFNYKDYLQTQPQVNDMLEKIKGKLKDAGLNSELLLDME